jgi:hypothetical protein
LLPAETLVPRLGEPHLTDEEAEDFVRSALSEPALAGAEEHLLLCEPCRRRVEALDRFVADLRPAARRPHLWTWFRPRRALPCR